MAEQILVLLKHVIGEKPRRSPEEEALIVGRIEGLGVMIIVGINVRSWVSEDDGATWSEHERRLPRPKVPTCRGAAIRLPAGEPSWDWSVVAVDPEGGLGIAAACESLPQNEHMTGTHLLRTSDGGHQWSRFWPEGSLLARARAGSPHGAIDAVVRRATIGLLWPDLPVQNGGRSHFLVSDDAGASFRHHVLGGLDIAFASAPHAVTLFGDHRGWILDGEVLEAFRWEWGPAEGVAEDTRLQQIVFLSPEHALALVLLRRGRATEVALVRADDAGRTWRIVRTWKAPPNPTMRHVLALSVGRDPPSPYRGPIPAL